MEYNLYPTSRDILHFGKGHEDNPPGRGSGRYPWGSGKEGQKAAKYAKRASRHAKYKSYISGEGSSKENIKIAKGKELKKSKILPKNATYQNLDEWGKKPETNILYISGYSGSGKSTVALKMKDNDTEIIHLDSYFDNKNGPHSKDFDNYLNDIKSDFKKIQTPKDKITINEWGKVVEKFENEIESYGNNAFKRNKKVIVEGVQILDDTLRPDKTYFNDKPCIMLNTNMALSSIRANKRDNKKFQISDIRNRMNWNKDIRNFKKSNKLKHSIITYNGYII